MTSPQELMQTREPEAFPLAAPAKVVNRTHRVVREQALAMRAQRSRSRSLWLPLALCSSLMAVLCVAVWFFVESPEIASSSVADTGNQLLLLVWFVPVTIALLGLALFHRLRNSGSEEVSQ